jgi:type I restriction enzyme S subunit
MTWKRATLADVATIERVGVSPQDLDENERYIGLEHIDSDGTISEGNTVGSAQLRSTKFRFSSRHILYGKLRPYLRKVVRPQFSGVCSTDILPIRPCPAVSKDFLYHYLRAPEMVSLATQRCAGANLPRISPDQLADFEIPFPPLGEQKRIAAILDTADAIRLKCEQALRLTNTFLRSIFLDLFGDPATNPKGWPKGIVRDLVVSVNYGTSQKAHSEQRGTPVLRMNNITYDGGWDFTELKYTDFSESDVGKYLVRKGELLFNRTNSRELVGKTAVYREENPMAFAGYLVRAVASPDADAEYIAAYLNSIHGKTVLMAMCKSIVGMANINAQEMLAIPIHLPPSKVQKKFGDIARSVADRIKVRADADREAETLFTSLQHRAFRGEL